MTRFWMLMTGSQGYGLNYHFDHGWSVTFDDLIDFFLETGGDVIAIKTASKLGDSKNEYVL